MQKDQEWPFGPKKDYPFVFEYSPKLRSVNNEEFLNLFLGYPNCPLIGRYNQGQYRIADTKCHFEFQCNYQAQQGVYKCGQKVINLPEKMVFNLQNIPEVIKHNKPLQSKNNKIQEVHPLSFPVRKQLKFIFILTFGEIGKDFLNYLNHMYTLAHDLFIEQKLRRSVFMLPIYAYLPQKSGFIEQQVDKGLCLQNYRSEYLSLHLKYGAPAFSPNNMRLGLQGMKKVTSNPKSKKQAKKQILKQQGQKSIDQFLKKQQLIQSDDLFSDLQKEEKMQGNKDIGKTNKENKSNRLQHQGNNSHKGYVQFYTSVLLQNDYRVYYHWHIDNKQRRQMVEAALEHTSSVGDFFKKCQYLLGENDQCVKQALRIFSPKQ